MKKLFLPVTFLTLCLVSPRLFAQESMEEKLSQLDKKYYFCHVYGEEHTNRINVKCDGNEFVLPNENRGDSRWSTRWTQVLGIMRQRSGMEFKGCRVTVQYDNSLSRQLRHYCDFIRPYRP